MRGKSILILEIIWIVTGLLCTGAAIRIAVSGGGREIIIFVLMAVISFMFAWLRHNQRKKR